ncbi:hypothetical protein [Dulcicalothrix desertica]|nr:hypothetical protein [Dulcicalothrix desertica]
MPIPQDSLFNHPLHPLSSVAREILNFSKDWHDVYPSVDVCDKL